MQEKRFYGPAFQLARCGVRTYFGRCKIIIPEELPSPAIYVGRHQNMHGPVHVMAYSPIPMHLWCMHMFFDRKTCTEHLAGFTLSERLHYPPWLLRLCLRFYVGHTVACMHQMDAIPVYRGKREIIKTMKLSIDTLLAGENLIIFPDVSYDDVSNTAGQLYEGYLHLCKEYYKKTGKNLPIIPVCTPHRQNALVFGRPIVPDGTLPFAQERERVAQEVGRALDELYHTWDKEEA